MNRFPWVSLLGLQWWNNLRVADRLRYVQFVRISESSNDTYQTRAEEDMA